MKIVRFVMSNAAEDSSAGMDVVAQSHEVSASQQKEFRKMCSTLLKRNLANIQGDELCFGFSQGNTGYVAHAYRKQRDGQGRTGAWRVYACLVSGKKNLQCSDLIGLVTACFTDCEQITPSSWVSSVSKPKTSAITTCKAHESLAIALSLPAYRGAKSFAFPCNTATTDIDISADSDGHVDIYNANHAPMFNRYIMMASFLVIALVVASNLIYIRNLRSENKTLSELRIPALTKQVAELTESITTHTNQIARLTSGVVKLTSERDDALTQLREIEQDFPDKDQAMLSRLRAERSEDKKVLGNLKELVANLHTSLEEAKQQTSNLVDRLEKRIEASETIENDNSAVDSPVSQSEPWTLRRTESQ